MSDMEQEKLSMAYAEVLATDAGRRIFADILSKMSVTVPVYAFGIDNNISDLAYRDGQRNAAIYVYNQMALANPEITAKLHYEVMIKENIKQKEAEQNG